MIAGYHTAGLLLHDVCDVIAELARLGYDCVAIRPHPGNFHPSSPQFSQQVLRISDAIERSHVGCVIDLDAMFLHDVAIGRGPSLVATEDAECDAARRWIERWATIADEIGAHWVTFSSGVTGMSDFVSDEENLDRLSHQLKRLVDATARNHVRLAIRPRYGDAIATVAHFERLRQWLSEETSENLYLAADVGEMLAGGELPIADRLARNVDALACLYLCDHRAGTIGDQRIGQGDVALSRILQALQREGFDGPAIVRIEGHCELGLAPAREALMIFRA